MMFSPPRPAFRSKQAVARSFSDAAATYDAIATLQRDVGAGLLSRVLDVVGAPRRWLDLGCGTGVLTNILAASFPTASGIGLDLAEGMVHRARVACQDKPVAFVIGDIEALPLASGTFDLLFSNLAIQWCEDLPALWDNARRVLRPGGAFVFSTLLAGTLGELEQSWRAVDGHVHVNGFRTFDAYAQTAGDHGFDAVAWEQEDHTVFFPTVLDLMKSLKGIGAHNVNNQRAKGLTGPRRVKALATAFEDFRTSTGLPLTYRVLSGTLRKRS